MRGSKTRAKIHSTDKIAMKLELHSVIRREMKSRGLNTYRATGVPFQSAWMAREAPAIGKNLIHVKQLADFFACL